jgi:hypothetical protein
MPVIVSVIVRVGGGAHDSVSMWFGSRFRTIHFLKQRGSARVTRHLSIFRCGNERFKRQKWAKQKGQKQSPPKNPKQNQNKKTAGSSSDVASCNFSLRVSEESNSKMQQIYQLDDF